MHVLQIVCFACGTCVLKTKLNRPGFFCATVHAGANSSGICHVVSRCSQIVVVIIASIAKLSLALSPVQNNMFLSRARKFMTKKHVQSNRKIDECECTEIFYAGLFGCFYFFSVFAPTSVTWGVASTGFTVHCSLSAVTHVPFHASMLRPASQAGPMHETAGVGKLMLRCSH